jgi:hypothetical protein
LFGSSGQAPQGPAWFESCQSDEQLSCEPPACSLEDECCDDLRLPCQGLSQAACSTHASCEAIFGKPISGGTDLEGSGGEAAFEPFDQFLGCHSSCSGAGGAAMTCTFDPARPEHCFAITTTATPDGWPDLLDCDFAPGQCAVP